MFTRKYNSMNVSLLQLSGRTPRASRSIVNFSIVPAICRSSVDRWRQITACCLAADSTKEWNENIIHWIEKWIICSVSESSGKFRKIWQRILHIPVMFSLLWKHSRNSDEIVSSLSVLSTSLTKFDIISWEKWVVSSIVFSILYINLSNMYM